MHEARIASLEKQIKALENGEISSSSEIYLNQLASATTSIIDTLNTVSEFVIKVFAQFGTLIADKFVAATNSEGTSSAGTATILAGNIVTKVINAYVQPSTKIFVTFNSQITGSWYVSDKQVGSFRVLLSETQGSDVTFDYFLVQTEGQIATSTPSIATTNNQQPTDNGSLTSTTTPPATVETAATSDTTSATSTSSDNSSQLAVSGGDTVPPVVTLVGEAAMQINIGEAFTDPGATATDDTDGDITAGIVATGSVDIATAGLYTLTYTATDVAGNVGSVSRVVSLVATSTTP